MFKFLILIKNSDRIKTPHKHNMDFTKPCFFTFVKNAGFCYRGFVRNPIVCVVQTEVLHFLVRDFGYALFLFYTRAHLLKRTLVKALYFWCLLWYNINAKQIF